MRHDLTPLHRLKYAPGQNPQTDQTLDHQLQPSEYIRDLTQRRQADQTAPVGAQGRDALPIRLDSPNAVRGQVDQDPGEARGGDAEG